MGHDAELLAVAGKVKPYPTKDQLFQFLFSNNVKDDTGNHNGLNNGGIFVPDRYLDADKAISVSGGAHVSTADWVDPNVISFFSWISPAGTPAQDRIISWRADGSNYLILRILSGKIQVLWNKGDPDPGIFTTDSAVIIPGVSQSYGFTLNGTNPPVFYHNGPPQPSSGGGTSPRSLVSSPFTMGWDASGSGYNGIMDDNVAWGVIKTPAEMLAIHNGSKP